MASAQAKEDHYYELRFTTEHGLPSNSIRALEFDANGKLWVGSLAGLSVFDGSEFTSVPLSNGGSPLAHRITALHFADGELLIGTQSGLLLSYEDGEFEPLVAESLGPIHRIGHLEDGTIIAAGQQLVIVNESGSQVLGNADARWRAAGMEWHDGSLYAAGGWGLWKLDVDGPVQLDDTPHEALLPGPADELLLVRGGQTFSLEGGAPLLNRPLTEIYATLRVNERMTMLACSTSTQLLFATGDPSMPLMVMEDKTAERPRAFAVRGRGSWIGTDRDGLTYVERTPSFHMVRAEGEPPLYARNISLLDNDSALIQPPSGPPVRFTQVSPWDVGTMTDLDYSGGIEVAITGSTRVRDGINWLASPAGVLRLEGDTISPTQCSPGPVGAITETPTGEVWATEPGQIFRVLPDGARGRSLPGPLEAPRYITADARGIYFAAPGGIFHLETSAEDPGTRCVLELADSVEPRALKIGPDGDLWLTTYGDGLFRIHEDGHSQFTTATGLSCDYLGWLDHIPGTGTEGPLLLLNSNQGLMSVPTAQLTDDPALLDESLRSLSTKESDGPTGARLQCGTLLLPTLDGLYGYSLQQRAVARQVPQTVIDSLIVNGAYADDPVSETVPRVFGSADVDIGFQAIAMPSTADATFSYRMLPVGMGSIEEAMEATPWIDSYSAKSVQYFNLPPGQYTFQVRSRLPGTKWSDPTTLRVAEVLPHLYQRPQAQIALVAALLALIVYSFVRFIRAEGATQQLSSEVEQSKTLAAEAVQREVRYARLLDSSHDGIVLIESDGRISFANEAMTRSFGFERDELLERDAAWLGVPDVVSVLAGAKGGTKGDTAGPLLSRNVQVVDKFGIPHESDLIAARTELDGKECLLVVIRDLTADNRLLDRLDTSERRFQALFQGAPAALITFSSDLRIIDWNRRAEALLGLGSTLADQLTDAFDDDISRLNFTEQVDRTIKTRQETQAIHEARGHDGSKLRISWTISPLSTDLGKVTVLMAVAKDLREEERAQARLKELQRRLAMAQESERSRIAREIHDDLSQRLAATSMNTATIRARLPEEVDAEVPALLTGLHNDLERLMADIHALSRQLHPTVLDDLGLPQAIGSECARQDSLTDAEVSFVSPKLALQLPSDVSLAFFRITQESIRNAIKHAQPKMVEVRLEQSGPLLRLSIEDDGVGFELKDGRAESSAGLGLVSMQERARLIGATFKMTSEPGKGTTVIVEFSLEPQPETPVEP